jgi:hypothetical protein
MTELQSLSPSKIYSKVHVTDFVSQADQTLIQTVHYLKKIDVIAFLHFTGLITLYDANTHLPIKTYRAQKGAITTCYFHATANRLYT